MIQSSHARLQRWAEWSLTPTGSISLGVGTSIESRIMEGKGQIMPGAPGGSSGRVYIDLVAIKAERFLRTLRASERRLVRVFYLHPGVNQDKATKLGIPIRTMYDRLHGIHEQLDIWWQE